MSWFGVNHVLDVTQLRPLPAFLSKLVATRAETLQDLLAGISHRHCPANYQRHAPCCADLRGIAGGPRRKEPLKIIHLAWPAGIEQYRAKLEQVPLR
jgi:hypothetical protein